MLDLAPRVPYGVITNRHFKGALPDEFPEKERLETASVENPEAYGDVSVFCPIHQEDGIWYGTVDDNGTEMKFPLSPFLGIMGVAPDTSEKVSTVPPINVGGNLDINELGVGATLYLPVEVEGAKFYTGDPHFVQGDGEVALTALEGSLRGTVRLTLLKAGDSSIPKTSEKFTQAFAETEKYWIPIGLNEDLDEAMKQSVRESVNFLSNQFNLDRAKVYAYLSAGVDYEVYNQGAKYLSWFLTPATVCLAIPLYEQWSLLKKNYKAVVVGIASGVFTSLTTVLVLSKLMNLSHAEYVTLLPKSITTAIGMGVSEELGGYVTITVAVIVVTGVLGNIFGELICRIFRIKEPIAKGLALGSAAHAIGTAKAMEMGEIEGAMSSLSIAVAGILTVALSSLFAGFM